ncbi:MAG: NAD-dependent epimerase/dehydratase family protein [Anaerolineales bacterium]
MSTAAAIDNLPVSLPTHFEDVKSLEEFMSRPSATLISDLARIEGDILILGAGGKMGPTLARMARRAAPNKNIVAVARFSESGLPDRLKAHDIECLKADLLDRSAIEALPKLPNVIYMAGQKFGTSSNASQTWAMNVAVPFMVAEAFRASRLVVFSTGCVYPYMDVNGPGASEDTPTIPPSGDYANSCVGRERMFEYASRKYSTAGRFVRLSYAIDMRYGVLFDIAHNVLAGQPQDLSMSQVNVIWQGEANEQSLRLLTHCTAPISGINITGPRVSVRWLAEQFGQRFGRRPVFSGAEAGTAWVFDISLSQRLLGPTQIGIETMLDWVTHWVASGNPSLGKPTHFDTRDGRY